MRTTMLWVLGVSAGAGLAFNPTHPGVLLLGWLIVTLLLIPMALVLQGLFPRFLRRSSENAERAPWSSLFVGVLTVVISLLAANVAGNAHGLGQLFGLLVFILLVVISVFGIAASFRSLGSRFYFSMNSPRADQSFPATLLGGIVLSLAAQLPVLGWVAFPVAWLIGTGAGLIALFNRKPAHAPVPPVIKSSPIPPAA